MRASPSTTQRAGALYVRDIKGRIPNASRQISHENLFYSGQRVTVRFGNPETDLDLEMMDFMKSWETLHKGWRPAFGSNLVKSTSESNLVKKQK